MYYVKYHNWKGQTGGLREGPDQQQFYGHMASVAYGNTTAVISSRLMKLFGRDHKDSKVIHYTTYKGSTIDPLSVSGC